jgi:hypothetical protein
MLGLVLLSLLVNIVVAGMLPFAMLSGTGMDAVYGPDSAARRILATLYGTIALTSLAALISPALTGNTDIMLRIVMVLLPMQCIYKLATWPVVGLSHPVVQANLAITALHCVTLIAVAITLVK